MGRRWARPRPPQPAPPADPSYRLWPGLALRPLRSHGLVLIRLAHGFERRPLPAFESSPPPRPGLAARLDPFVRTGSCLFVSRTDSSVGLCLLSSLRRGKLSSPFFGCCLLTSLGFRRPESRFLALRFHQASTERALGFVLIVRTAA